MKLGGLCPPQCQTRVLIATPTHTPNRMTSGHWRHFARNEVGVSSICRPALLKLAFEPVEANLVETATAAAQRANSPARANFGELPEGLPLPARRLEDCGASAQRQRELERRRGRARAALRRAQSPFQER